ncbi:MAG: hypothetical protein B6I30_00345 [Desulfobacteraceae bacterium 4572_187]|nr:MAG: hypothetical protein B6I30_00345 [Desulfobacteraceae bacterium 4572_187]
MPYTQFLYKFPFNNFKVKLDELIKSITDGARRKCPWGAKSRVAIKFVTGTFTTNVIDKLIPLLKPDGLEKKLKPLLP